MTENERDGLAIEVPRWVPHHELMDASLRTLQDCQELLQSEGWEFVGLDERFQGDGFDPLKDRFEVWMRTVGGAVEWAGIWRYGQNLGTPPERCWIADVWPVDPRTMND